MVFRDGCGRGHARLQARGGDAGPASSLCSCSTIRFVTFYAFGRHSDAGEMTQTPHAQRTSKEHRTGVDKYLPRSAHAESARQVMRKGVEEESCSTRRGTQCYTLASTLPPALQPRVDTASTRPALPPPLAASLASSHGAVPATRQAGAVGTTQTGGCILHLLLAGVLRALASLPCLCKTWVEAGLIRGEIKYGGCGRPYSGARPRG